MNTKRVPAREYSVAAERAFQAYQQLKPDLVVLGDDNALYYLLPKLYNEPSRLFSLGLMPIQERCWMSIRELLK